MSRYPLRFAILVCALLPLTPAVQADFSVGDLHAKSGQRVSGMLRVPARADEGADIPVTVIDGVEAGPVLALIAGTHGYEYPPVVALQNARDWIDPGSLRGTVVMVHIANPASFFGRTIYYNPIDGLNLNRAFPGDADGSQSRRIAHALTVEIIERADYVVDLHAGDGNEALRPFVYMPETGIGALDAGSRRLAVAFGIDHIVIDRAPLRDPGDSLYVDQTALTRGIPAITTETGQLGSSDRRWVELAERGIRKLLIALDMTEGDAPENDAVVWLTDYVVVSSPGTGLFHADVTAGHTVAENSRLGTLVDVFGEPIAVIRAPFSGVVNYVVDTPPIREGEPVAMISRIVDE